MRISIIGPAYPLRGGIAHHVYWLWQELTSRSHCIQVVSFRKLYPRMLFPGTTELDTSRLKLDSGALPILTAWNPATWLQAYKRVKDFSPDVIVFEWWQPFFGLVVGTLARLFRCSGVSSVIECHNILPHEGNPLDTLLMRFALSAADHLITHSERDRADLLAILPGKEVRVLSLPVLDEFCRSGVSSRNGRTILFFGKVRKYKGLSVLLAAMPKVLARIDCKLIVVGEFYNPLDKYWELIRKYQIESHVQIDDRYVPNEEVPSIFDRADVLVLPYVSASQSGVARIALSNALPVIASSAGGLSEQIEENVNGLLFTPGDSDALAGQLVNYFANNLGPVFSENILKASYDQSSRHLGEAIEEVLRSSCAARLEGAGLS